MSRIRIIWSCWTSGTKLHSTASLSVCFSGKSWRSFTIFLHRNDRLPGTGTGAFFTVPVPPKFSGSGSATLVWPGAESVILNEAAPAMLLELGTYYLIKITLHYQIRNFNPFFFKFSKKFVFNPIQIRVIWNFMKSPILILIRQKNHSLLSSDKKIK